MLTRNTIFWNVMTGALESTFKKNDPADYSAGKVENFSCSPIWYRKKDDPFIHYPHVLISAATFNKKPNIRQDIKCDDDSFVFIDSGGFQLAEGVKSVIGFTREKALAFSEANGDIYPILDYPVSGKIGIKAALEYTIASAKYYSETRSVDHHKILNVLSAKNYAGMDVWYDGVKDFKFDGWGYGGHKNNNKSQIQALLFLLHKGEFDRGDNVFFHVFGTTDLKCLIYILYVQHIFNQKGINVTISFDSSSASAAAIWGNMYMFTDYLVIKSIGISNQYDYSNMPKDAKLPCPCPICSGISDLYSAITGPDSYTLLACHNFWVIYEYKKRIEQLFNMNVPDIFESFPSEIKNNLLVIKKAFDADSIKKAVHILDVGFFNTTNRKMALSPSTTLSNFF